PTPPSVYWLPYNYANASSTQPGVNLANGSVLILATTTENNSPIRLDSFLPAPSTLSSRWIAAAPGYTLSFSDTSYAYLADLTQIRQLATSDDLTLETWVRPQTTIRDRARILHYQSNTQSYTLALQRQAGSPDTAPTYSVIAGVNQLVMQSREIIPANRWTHLAVAYDQSYAVELGNGGYLDCGNNPTLDIRADLTIEVFLQLPDLRGNYSLLSKGIIDDGTSEQVPYALFVQAPGRLVFLFEDAEGTNLPDDGTRFAATRSLTPGQFHKIAVTRRRRTEVTAQGQAYVQYDINLYIDRQPAGNYTIGSENNSAPDVGGNSQALQIGAGFLINNDTANPIQPLSGTISEMRLWNTVRATVGDTIRGDEEGLVSWWQFEENVGRVATDSKSNNHARFNGTVTWVNNPDPNGSRLVVYRDGIALNLQPIAPLSPIPVPQFTLGGLRQANNSIAESFYGELEEVRIWSRRRTEEQLQDNRFGRLLDERSDLIAYYTFDAETGETLSDNGLRGNNLTLVNPIYTLSTAPIGDDTPQVRNTLLGTITPFSDVIHSPADVQEYGDLQYDAENNLTGSFKRCYTFIKNGQWQIISGFKVGDLVAEWVGQTQFDPQLI
ncbi:MAG: LamG-like jellyroll fold domain-containing protein, partial [Kovacikia sp.]